MCGVKIGHSYYRDSSQDQALRQKLEDDGNEWCESNLSLNGDAAYSDDDTDYEGRNSSINFLPN